MKNRQGPAGWVGTTLRILAKLGILRSGARSATYTSGRNRPAEFLMPDVLNAERDLTTRQDIKKLLGGTGQPGEPKQ